MKAVPFLPKITENMDEIAVNDEEFKEGFYENNSLQFSIEDERIEDELIE